MKALRFLVFAVLALGMATACSENNAPEQEADTVDEQELLKSKLLGDWVISGQQNSYVYAFADDTVYTKTKAGDVAGKSPYLVIAEDSIRITRNWTTHNKVVFYSNDSVWIEDFIPSDAAVYPPMFGNALLIRWLNNEEGETPVRTVTDFSIPIGCGMSYAKMQRDSVYLINSQEELAKFFTCENDPPIDFSTKTILFAFGWTTNGIANISKELLFEDDTWYLAVDVTLNLTAMPQGWRTVLITEKLNAQRVVLKLDKHF
jgi:hypothetical protein